MKIIAPLDVVWDNSFATFTLVSFYEEGWFSKIILTLTGQYLWPISATKIIFKYLVVVWLAIAPLSLASSNVERMK